MNWFDRRFDIVDNTLYRIYFRMHTEAPLAELQFTNLTGRFLELMILPRYGRFDTAQYNQAHAVDLGTYDRFKLPRTVPPPQEPVLRAEWIEFVREDLNPSFIVLDERCSCMP